MNSTNIIIIVFGVLIGAYLIYRDKIKSRLSKTAFAVNLIDKGKSREEVLFQLITHYKLTVEEANQIINAIDLSGLTDPYR